MQVKKRTSKIKPQKKQNTLIDTEHRLVVIQRKGVGWQVGEKGGGSQPCGDGQ